MLKVLQWYYKGTRNPLQTLCEYSKNKDEILQIIQNAMLVGFPGCFIHIDNALNPLPLEHSVSSLHSKF